MERLWILKRIKGDLRALVKNTGIEELFIKILINRNIKEQKDIIKFFKGNLDDLYEPYMMKDMENGVAIIKNAIHEQKNIVIYGDYDVDGVSSTVILYKGLKRCGAKVSYYVPNREEEGYGMCISGIQKLKEEGAQVILTCDNGISALEEVKYAVNEGMEVVVTDHHQLSFKTLENGDKKYILPEAHAIINPHREDCEYPFKKLCGAGIAYKFVQALYRLFNINNRETYELLQYASIATICDVVDLVDENRIIVKEGLKLVNETNNLGLKCLLKELNLDEKEIKGYNVGFNIGPCINATGRLKTADLSIELLLSEDEEKAKKLANTLYELNKTRQEMTMKNVEEIIEELNKKKDNLGKVLVIYKENVHESIAGIVAGRIKDHFNLPTIVLTKGKEIPKGSARSIEGYNMFEELLKCKDLIYKFGGHPMAAGLSIEECNIDKLRHQLNENCTLSKEELMPKIKLENVLPENYSSNNFRNYLEMLEPYGKGNPKPLFGAKNIKVIKGSILGKNKNVLKLNLNINNNIVKAIMFSELMEEFIENLKEVYGELYVEQILSEGVQNLYMDFVFSLDINEYMGRKSVELRVQDFRI